MKFLDWFFRYLVCHLFLNLIFLFSLPVEIAGQNAFSHVSSAVQKGNWSPVQFIFIDLGINLLAAGLLALPFLFMRRKPHPAFVAVGIFCVWILVALLESPTLFLGNVLHPTWVLGSASLKTLLLFGGITFVVSASMIVLLIALWPGGKTLRRFLATSCFYAFIFLFIRDDRHLWSTSLEPGSVILVLSDSLRSDYLDSAHAPRLTEEINRRQATRNEVLPVSSRTAVSLTSLFTGVMPVESKITNMFADFSQFQTELSRVAQLRQLGFCTVAVTEYPGDFLGQSDFGFERMDVPGADWNSQLHRVLMKRDPFLLATLSWGRLREYLPSTLNKAFLGLDEFADPKELYRRLENEIRKCEGRKVFALAFTNITHMPYIQRAPNYGADLNAWGHYSWQPVGSSQQGEQIRTLYANAVKEFDERTSRFVSSFFKSEANGGSSLIISSDHGEYLFDGVSFTGHGDHIEHLDGLTVPWVTFGALGAHFPTSPELRSNLEISDILFSSMMGRDRSAESFPLYTETEVWLDQTNSPSERIAYPSGSELFQLHHDRKNVVLSPRYALTVELAKHRAWRVDGEWIEIRPALERDRIYRNGRETDLKMLPLEIRPHIEKVQRRNTLLREEIKNQNGEASSR